MIELKGVHKAFGAKKVLQGVDLKVGRGESLVLLGASGSGKSVTLKLLLGLEKADKGKVEVAEDRIGMLFQNAALFDSMSVWENVAFALLNNLHMDEEEAREVAIAKLASVGLPANAADLMPADLSGGMRKRVGLARAIADNPKILLFDEPTTGLDPIMSDIINELIIKVVKELGATALTITHDMRSARRIADRVAMLLDGQIVWTGTPDRLSSANHQYVADFAGRT